MSRAALAQGIVVVLATVVAGCAAQTFSSADGGAGDAASTTDASTDATVAPITAEA